MVVGITVWISSLYISLQCPPYLRSVYIVEAIAIQIFFLYTQAI